MGKNLSAQIEQKRKFYEEDTSNHKKKEVVSDEEERKLAMNRVIHQRAVRQLVDERKAKAVEDAAKAGIKLETPPLLSTVNRADIEAGGRYAHLDWYFLGRDLFCRAPRVDQYDQLSSEAKLLPSNSDDNQLVKVVSLEGGLYELLESTYRVGSNSEFPIIRPYQPPAKATTQFQSADEPTPLSSASMTPGGSADISRLPKGGQERSNAISSGEGVAPFAEKPKRKALPTLKDGYLCQYPGCGKRFGMQSLLNKHEVVHVPYDKRPYP
jgi:hypothetical protein